MSLPPTTVQIKRKRTDEPVDYLRIHELNSKRQRIVDGYVFERQPQVASPTLQPSSTNTYLRTRPIKSIHRAPSSQKLRLESGSLEQGVNSTQARHANDAQVPKPNTVADSDVRKTSAHVRRFHMSRTTSNGDAARESGARKDNPIVFIERRSQPGQDKSKSKAPLASPIPPDDARVQKKPGRNARTPIPPLTISSDVASRPAQSNNIPEAFKHRWNIPSEQLAKEMEAYALQEIGLRLAQQEQPTQADRPPIITYGQGHAKFKPKTEIKRYAERHPDRNMTKDDAMIVDNGMGEEEATNEQDYVTEIYVRVPIEDIEASVINAGLLILDSQPDIDAFYGQDNESDEDDEFDDEDENAENHYSADYPDEEVDSDDEYGRNVYNYREHASDDEYDDMAYSDNEDGHNTQPWKKRPGAGPFHDVYA